MIGGVFGVATMSWHMNWVLAIILCLLVGLAVGAWQGFWVAYVGIPAFIVTLASMMIFRGFAQLLVGQTISGFSPSFIQIGNGAVPNVLGFTNTPAIGYLEGITLLLGIAAIVSFILSQLRARCLRRAHELEVSPAGMFWARIIFVSLIIALFTFLLANSTGGFPIILGIVGILVLLFAWVLGQTPFGRNIYAVGGNYKAAALSGVNAKAVTFNVFLIAGVLASIAGIVVTSRAGAAVANAGQGYELDAIAACFIGGAAVTGGVGKISGAMIGALIMGVLNIGLSILAVDPAWQQAIKGIVLLGAVAFDLVNKKRAA